MDMQDVQIQMSELLEMNKASVQVYDAAMQKMQGQQAGQSMGMQGQQGMGMQGGQQDMRQKLQQFRDEHQHHAQEIQNWFQQSGQRPQQVSPEFQTLLQAQLMDVQMAQGTDEVLKAMTLAEAFDNAEYGEAVRVPAPNDVQRALQSHLDMEHKHWQFVEQYSPLKVGSMAGMQGGMSGRTGGGY